jgi:hypothetical protein
MPVAILVPEDKDITGLEYSIRENDGFLSILTVIAWLVVNRAIVQSQWEEAFKSQGKTWTSLLRWK